MRQTAELLFQNTPKHTQISAPNGEVIITNDGATILQRMTVTQPAAKMLVELSKSQVGWVGRGHAGRGWTKS